jgi:hypothetical protein
MERYARSAVPTWLKPVSYSPRGLDSPRRREPLFDFSLLQQARHFNVLLVDAVASSVYREGPTIVSLHLLEEERLKAEITQIFKDALFFSGSIVISLIVHFTFPDGSK